MSEAADKFFFDVMNEYMASLTLEWKDVDKFVFLWHGELVLVHYNEGRYTVLTDLEPEVEPQVYQFLTRRQIKPSEVLEEENE